MSEPNYHTTKFFTENLLAIEMNKTETFMNKPIYLELSILELSKILMCEFYYDYAQPKYDEKAKRCYMDTDGFIVYIKAYDIYEDIAKDVEIRFDTNYEIECNSIDKPLPKNKKVIGLMKDELVGTVITKFVGVRAKTYSYLIHDGSKDKKAKGTKNV